VQMPNMSGLEATVAIRQVEEMTGAHTPIIAMTAHVMAGDRQRCLESGMDDFVSKPLDPKTLFEVINRVMEQLANAAVPVSSDVGDVLELPRENIFDFEQAVERVDGDRTLLVEVTRMFCQEYPGMSRELREAFRRGDAMGLERAAHKLKGSLGAFCAHAAFEAAQKVEELARGGDLDNAEGPVKSLEVELSRLMPLLEEFEKEGVACKS